ncbi:hypothetical protein B0T17DRAFT_508166 [Bombardia bombarda]|uniref:Uncharacterized protein n=1 Tax=Bombardia bombarda TaxID=252184 RepID=A0AA39X1K6_9PEZI|nr:hypothetical protein B0T17DRAFT_508166 [Bombardia bombarda]
MHFQAPVLLAASLASLATAEVHHTITPVAELAARQTSGAEDSGDCDASITEFASCAGEGLSTDLCLGTASTLSLDTACGCSQATSLYNCYQSYCTKGTDYSVYYAAVSVCSTEGYGNGAAPTGTAAAAGGAATTSKSAGTAVRPSSSGELAIWGIWASLSLGAFVAMLV